MQQAKLLARNNVSYSANLRGDDAQASSPTIDQTASNQTSEATSFANRFADSISYEESEKATSPQRLAELKDRIATGSYNISDSQLASAILDRHQLTWSSI